MAYFLPRHLFLVLLKIGTKDSQIAFGVLGTMTIVLVSFEALSVCSICPLGTSHFSSLIEQPSLDGCQSTSLERELAPVRHLLVFDIRTYLYICGWIVYFEVHTRNVCCRPHYLRFLFSSPTDAFISVRLVVSCHGKRTLGKASLGW